MPVVKCKCGNTTNSAVSDYWKQHAKGREQANECYAAFIEGKWGIGCAFQKADPYVKKFVMELIRRTKAMIGK